MVASRSAGTDVDTSDGSDRLLSSITAGTVARPRSIWGAPVCPDVSALDAHVAFLGVPYDLGGTPGSRHAPDSLRDVRVYDYGRIEGDAHGAPGGYYDIEADRYRLAGVTMADCGDVLIRPADMAGNFARITDTVRRIVERGSLPVTIGGDHSITAATVPGFDRYQALDLVHFDAHHDFHHPGEGPITSGTPIRVCAELPWVRNITHVGIRSLIGPRQPVDDARARGSRILTADRFRALGPEAAMAQVPHSEALYVTLDIDVMDPGICPGTGTPEPAGLSYLEMRAALRAVADRGRVVGIDLVEVSPPRDPLGITTKMASHLLLDLVTAVFESQGTDALRP